MTALKPFQFTSRSGLRLQGYETASRGLPLIVFRHGNGMPGLSYLPFLAPLIEHYDLLLIDTQGHGGSEAGERYYGWDKAADEVIDLLEEKRRQHGPLIGMGHSYGSILTTLCAARRPDLYAGVVLLDPIFFPQWAARSISLPGVRQLWRKYHPLAKQALRRRNQWPDRDAALQYFNGRGMFKRWHPDALRAYVDAGLVAGEEGLELSCPPWMEAAIFASYPRRLWQETKTLRLPVFYFYGKFSYGFVGTSGRWLARRYPNFHLFPMAGGHCFMQEHPEASSRAVLECLQTLKGPDTLAG